MPDVEKVIKGLEICSAGEWNSTGGRDHTDCPYYPAGYTGCTCKLLMRDALALLKAQEPRAMTLEDAKGATGYVFVQSRTCNILELKLIKDGLVYDSFTVPIAVDDLWWAGYNKQWRLWTSYPTDEQMEAVKWE